MPSLKTIPSAVGLLLHGPPTGRWWPRSMPERVNFGVDFNGFQENVTARFSQAAKELKSCQSVRVTVSKYCFCVLGLHS